MADVNLDAVDTLKVAASEVGHQLHFGQADKVATDSMRLRLADRASLPAAAVFASESGKVGATEDTAPERDLIVAGERGTAVGTGSARSRR